MNTIFLKMLVKTQNLMDREEGQDLVEYALIVALIALACVAGVTAVGNAINVVFNGFSNSV